MYKIAKLSDAQRRIIFRNTAQKMGLNEAIIENVFGILRYFKQNQYYRQFVLK